MAQDSPPLAGVAKEEDQGNSENQIEQISSTLLRNHQQLSHEIGERKRAEQITRALFKITNAVRTTKDLGELYTSIHRILGEVIDLTNFFIAIYEKDTGRVFFPYFVDQYDAGKVYADQFDEKSSLTGSVILKEAPVFYDREELRKRKNENRVIGTIPQVWIGVPLVIEEQVIGVMSTQSYDNENLFDEMDFDILISVSGQVALAIERKRNEQALIESEKKYRTIIETIDEGYFELDLNHNLTLVNKAMCRMLDRSESELLNGYGHDSSDNPTHPESITPLSNAIHKNQFGQTLEMMFSHQDGHICIVETVISTIRNDLGQITGYRGIARDVTQRKSAENSQKLLEEKLQQAQRLEALGTLAGGVAHDFNNLLMGIQGRIDLLQSDMSLEHPHLAQIKSIEEYVSSAATLTSRLLGFARGGKYELRATDINSLLESSLRMFSRTKKEIIINTLLDYTIDGVEVDPNQIEQVFINLLVNASQAMDGGGTIDITTRQIVLDNRTADLHEIASGNYIEIRVKDTGMGMDDTTLEKIFDPFFTTKSMGGGTGLGLSMVYGIIKNHSGAISVTSKVSYGTCFTILLPATTKEIVAAPPVRTETKTGSETILLVDDEPMILDVAQKMLKLLGYDVLTASSGPQAMETFHQNRERIGLLIVDMIMPGMSGGQLFDEVRKIQPEAAVLLSSGYSVEGEAREILQRGCKGFIQKPFSISELSNKIRSILAFS